MTAMQALQILDQATQHLNVNRQSHNQIISALKNLEAFVLKFEPQPAPVAPSPTGPRAVEDKPAEKAH